MLGLSGPYNRFHLDYLSPVVAHGRFQFLFFVTNCKMINSLLNGLFALYFIVTKPLLITGFLLLANGQIAIVVKSHCRQVDFLL